MTNGPGSLFVGLVICHWSFSRRMLILPRPCFEGAKTTGSGRVYGNTSALAVALALRANPLYCRQRKVNDPTLFGGHGLQTQRLLLRQHFLGRHLGQKDKLRFSVLSIIIRIENDCGILFPPNPEYPVN